MELLLLGDGTGKLHYVLIKDVNRLLCTVNKTKKKAHFCLHCVSEEALAKHKEICMEVNGTQAVKLPKSGSKIKFKNLRNSLPVPFVIYANFESILVPEETTDSDSDSDRSYTEKYQTHQACSFGLKTVCHYNDNYSGKYTSYIGKDAAYVFLKTVIEESKRCRQITNKAFDKKMVISPEEEKQFMNASNCYLCGGLLGEDRVRDHCHIKGHYRGAANNICNLKFSIAWKIPVASIT
ncbi:Hypothetical predicted protein [Paramuricea clavata]|uniref:Uncharacterized protein n=1 Tax=Paramuricea clavata TaxID=317549 RepID=A0A6S7G1Y7_PARCT|nr:Hypothetical predicted protein [Paramuricea clavata]